MKSLVTRQLRQWILLALSCVALLGCGEEAAPETAPQQKKAASDATSDETDPSLPADPDEDPAPAKTGLSGEDTFDLLVLPVLERNCQECHADPRLPVVMRAPLSIYNYSELKNFLEDGDSSIDNALLAKLKGENHEGGVRCFSGIWSSPCRTIIDWWKAEFGDDGSVPAEEEEAVTQELKSGDIRQVTSLRRVYGWAVDKDDLANAVAVKLYVDGELAASGTADLSGQDGNHEGNHAFILELPEVYGDGSARQMTLVGTIAGEDVELVTNYSFTAYRQSAAGRAYFDSTIAPLLSGCTGCHSVAYEAQFAGLISPSPADGGRAGNNELINNAGTRNGEAHRGGNRCGSGSPCTEFEEWWRLEFQ